MGPLVSIIIPVYNTPRSFLQEAVDSVINQSYHNLEIIIVDDGSTNGADLVCEKYTSDERVIVIHQRNRGLSAARNTGLDMVTGEFIAFLDSDDVLYPDIIKHMVSKINREDIDIVVGGVKKCSTTKRQLRHYNKRERDALILKDELMNSTEALSRLVNEQINHAVWNKLYRSKVWSTKRFPEGRVSEDVFTTFKVINDSNLIMTISDPAVYYRVRHGSISDTRSYKNVNDWFTAWIEWERFVSKNIPVIFSTEQLKKLQERITYESVFQWARIPIKDNNHNRIVKSQIIERIKSLYSKEWSLKTRFALIMLQWFPYLLRFVISIYSYSRREFF